MQIYTRAGVGFLANTMIIFTTSLLPLSLMTIIKRTNGIFASIFAYFMAGDKLSKLEIVALIAGFGGCYLIIATKDYSVNTNYDSSITDDS